MRRLFYVSLMAGLMILGGCKDNSVYTLSQSEVTISVNDRDFDPLDYLLKDGEALSKEDRSSIKTGADIDTTQLGTATFQFPEYELTLTIHIVDEEAPKLSLVGFEVKQGVVLTWNEENLEKLKPEMSDNYDSGALLKKSLHCDSVDTSKVGKQSIYCYIEDSSGNQTKKSVEMEVTK